jgi:ABC-type amino acid transport substrate-binding protein
MKFFVLLLLLILLAALTAGCVGVGLSGPATPRPTINAPGSTVQTPSLVQLHAHDVGIVVALGDDSIVDVASLRGHPIATVSVDVPGATRYATVSEAAAAFSSGKVDAIVGPYNTLYEYVAANPKIIKFAPNMYGA